MMNVEPMSEWLQPDPTERASAPLDRPLDRFVFRESVRDAVAQVAHEHGDAPPAVAAHLAELRSRLTRYVWRGRADGVSIERLISEVRWLLEDAASPDDEPGASEILKAQVFRWSIAAYVDEPALQLVPRFY